MVLIRNDEKVIYEFYFGGNYIMQGIMKPLISFLEGSDKRFVIPVYQRNYDWHQEQCAQLFDDLIDVIKYDRDNHFFGSIISVNDIGQQFYVVDGQQRLTTISILMIALLNALRDKKVNSEDEIIDQKIYNKYLIDQFSPKDKRIKLKTIKKDQEAYERIFKGNDLIKSSNITNNYEYFYKRICEKEITPDELVTAINKLQIIDISLKNGEDDPQLIFESINSTGIGLTEADKVRNYVLMGLKPVLQEKYYEEYWNVIESNTDKQSTNDAITYFIRNYLTIKTNKIPALSKVYITFKNYIKDYKLNVIDVLADMKEYSDYFSTITSANTKIFKVDLSLKRMNRLEVTVVYPYLLEVIKMYNESALNEGQLVNIVSLVETYVGRRIICSFPTNAMNKVFATLHYDCLKLKGDDHGDYFERLAYILSNKQGIAGLPDDDEIKTSIEKWDFYTMQFKNKIYILEKLENGDSKEHINIYENEDISIEHIMPQNLSKWKTYLGDNAEEIHSHWIHKLANLTLTAYNSKYSDSSFEDKRDMKDGFKESGFKLNKFVAEQSEWKEKQLIERQIILTEACIKAWELPEIKFVPERIEYEKYSIDDEFDFTGTAPLSYSFLGVDKKVESWKELITDVIIQVHQLNKSVIYRIIENQTDLSGWFIAEERPKWNKIDEGIYVWLNNDTFSKIKFINNLLALYDVDASDVIVELNIRK